MIRNSQSFSSLMEFRRAINSILNNIVNEPFKKKLDFNRHEMLIGMLHARTHTHAHYLCFFMATGSFICPSVYLTVCLSIGLFVCMPLSFSSLIYVIVFINRNLCFIWIKSKTSISFGMGSGSGSRAWAWGCFCFRLLFICKEL